MLRAGPVAPSLIDKINPSTFEVLNSKLIFKALSTLKALSENKISVLSIKKTSRIPTEILFYYTSVTDSKVAIFIVAFHKPRKQTKSWCLQSMK